MNLLNLQHHLLLILSVYHRNTAYPELEGNQKDHRFQLLTPHRITQNPNTMPESIVQMHLNDIRIDHCPGEPASVQVPKKQTKDSEPEH